VYNAYGDAWRRLWKRIFRNRKVSRR